MTASSVLPLPLQAVSTDPAGEARLPAMYQTPFLSLSFPLALALASISGLSAQELAEPPVEETTQDSNEEPAEVAAPADAPTDSLDNLGNYGQEVDGGYVLAAPEDFSWPDGTVINSTTRTINETEMPGMGQMNQTIVIDQKLTLASEDAMTMELETTIEEMTMVGADGQKQEMPAPPAETMTAEFTRSEDGEWATQVEGLDQATAAMVGEALVGNARMLRSDGQARLTYGTEPRAVGDSWEVDAAAFEQILGSMAGAEGMPAMNFEDVESTATFEAVEEHEGERCAVIGFDTQGTIQMEMPEGLGGGGGMAIEFDMTMTIRRSLERPLDLATEGSGTMNMDMAGMAVISRPTIETGQSVTLPGAE